LARLSVSVLSLYEAGRVVGYPLFPSLQETGAFSSERCFQNLKKQADESYFYDQPIFDARYDQLCLLNTPGEL
jgi:hypothetical protein